MRSFIRRSFTVSVLFLIVLGAFGLGSPARGVSASDDVSSKIAAADDALRRAYMAVLEAESAGANVSALLLELNAAGRNLTEAQLAYANGSLIEAVSKAVTCSAVADGVAGEAHALKDSSLVDAGRAEQRALAFFGAGSFAFLMALVLAWIVFRRFYFGRLVRMKPEVVSDAEA